MLCPKKNTKVSFENIKEECRVLPLQKRVRLTVACFNVTSDVNNPPNDFGAKLAAILTNGLQQVNCYRVLSTLKDSRDINDEIKYGQGAYTNKNRTKKGKQLGA
ncbi:hypothetical protein BDD43_6055 [Mucilaginibacter gracilis]|uniref:Uncharacterized protein n=1 Tax=Mucilaginibacter gracilis TaxID=423350 RepID=A0A495JCI2_9SPHI|nr:hypothetical protein [Mucilaginibacter gracilis]RKR85779.1 hypothetical protein BDD43_6055 [Mucilaginibacter gracilis]